jgi:hypothetical protein
VKTKEGLHKTWWPSSTVPKMDFLLQDNKKQVFIRRFLASANLSIANSQLTFYRISPRIVSLVLLLIASMFLFANDLSLGPRGVGLKPFSNQRLIPVRYCTPMVSE